MAEARAWLRVATDRAVVRRALLTGLVVGTLLTTLLNGDDLLHGRIDAGNAWRIAVAYLVPFLVSTVGSAAAIRAQRRGDTREFQLLEREIEAINRFPDQNPNPVMRVDPDGRLMYANAASAPIVAAWGATRGEPLPDDVRGRLDAAAEPPTHAVEVRAGNRTFSVLAVPVPGFDFLNVYGTDITATKAIDRFPGGNPNPVLRIGPDGALLYANQASERIVRSLDVAVGDPLPTETRVALLRSMQDPELPAVELRTEGRTYALTPVAIEEFGFINVYGTDITAARAVNKFPDQNPNPVLRVSPDGKLEYANPASAPVCNGLGLEVGHEIPAEVLGRIRDAAEGRSSDVLEVTGDGRIFEVLVVSVYEFDVINLYGTDVTAAREVRRAHLENERLLLNILPASIAKRLLDGEVVIADRFDEITVLFADVVDFTPLSARLSPTDVVALLNTIFSVFDGLVDHLELEKIKTVGDAYMVVGGLTPGADHAARVADLGLQMIEAIERLGSERGYPLRIRVGLHVGPAVAGVIGIKKFIYDVWGDTVNTASRMESNGIAGRVQVTAATYERLRDRFDFEERGTVDVKGKGPTQAYLLVGRRAVGPDGSKPTTALAEG